MRKTREEGDKIALANQITRGEFLNRYELEDSFSQIAAHIKAIICGSSDSQDGV